MTTTDTQSRTMGQRHVLIVDDIEDNRILLDRFLKACGYSTEMCASGREALSAISRRTPNIVLLDWMMPQFSGLDTLRAIREMHDATQLPVIMCTAIDEEVQVVAAITAGANDYMVKPISLPILRARMKVHLDQHLLVESMAHERSRAEQRLSDKTRALFASIGNPRRDLTSDTER
jgi:DNA-binding response OmpR family regulator